MLDYQSRFTGLCLIGMTVYGLGLCFLAESNVVAPEALFDHDAEAIQACAACLPPEVTLQTRFARYGPGEDQASQDRPWRPEEFTSVRVRLIELGASPRNGVIYASDGQPVHFYTPTFYRSSLAGNMVPVRHLIALRERDIAEVGARRHQGHVVALHPTSADVRMDPDYLKRFDAQPWWPTQSAPGTAAPPP